MRKCIVSLGFILFLFSFTYANTWDFNDWSSCTMYNCIYNPKIDYVTIYEVISDEFSGSILNRNWIFEVGQYNGMNRGAVTVGEKVNGWLTIKNLDIDAPVPITKWISGLDTAPKIYQLINTQDDFEISIYLTIPSRKPDKIHDEHHGIFL